jgi:hypothetical protein
MRPQRLQQIVEEVFNHHVKIASFNFQYGDVKIAIPAVALSTRDTCGLSLPT